jgi:hypothetical protein
VLASPPVKHDRVWEEELVQNSSHFTAMGVLSDNLWELFAGTLADISLGLATAGRSL